MPIIRVFAGENSENLQEIRRKVDSMGNNKKRCPLKPSSQEAHNIRQAVRFWESFASLRKDSNRLRR